MGLYIGKDRVTIATIIQQDPGDISISERYGLTLNNMSFNDFFSNAFNKFKYSF